LGDEEDSGMYSFNRNLVESEFEKHREDLITEIWKALSS